MENKNIKFTIENDSDTLIRVLVFLRKKQFTINKVSLTETEVQIQVKHYNQEMLDKVTEYVNKVNGVFQVMEY
jgi:hypothetical protein